MIATFVMTGDWIELPIDLWIEKKKIEDRITEKNAVTDGFGALYNSLCITADQDNAWPILVSDYTEDNQTNDWNRADFIELNPKGELQLPWNKQVQALNRPFVMWQAWDVIKVVAR
jgi:hypothetical protein